MFLYLQSQESSCDSLRVPHYDNKTIPKERGAPPRNRGGVRQCEYAEISSGNLRVLEGKQCGEYFLLGMTIV